MQLLCADAMRLASSPELAARMIRKSIGISNRIAEMAQVATGVETFGLENGLPRSVVASLNVALDEVISNVISYGYSDAANHLIEVELYFDGTDVTVVVRDDGNPFDPLQVAPPTLERNFRTRQVGGLGIHFVRNLMDQCSYSRLNGRNQLTLRKRVV